MPKVIAIVAIAENRIIGKDNKLPWHFKEDWKYFKKTTQGNTVLMGRKTYDSLPTPKLPGRKIVVATRNGKTFNSDVESTNDPVKFIQDVKSGKKTVQGDLFIAGGTEIYKLTLSECDRLLLTKIKGQYQGDAYFPDFDHLFDTTSQAKPAEDNNILGFYDFPRSK